MKKNLIKRFLVYYGKRKKVLIMTNLFLFLAMFNFQVQAGILDQNVVSLNMQNATLFEVMESIEEQTQVGFLYNESEINVKERISIKAEGKPLAQLLNEILPKIGVDFQIEEEIIVLMPKQEEIITVEEFVEVQQKIEIKGSVTDHEGTPLPGATIVEKGTQNGAITDVNGNYKLEVAGSASVLEISYIGFVLQEVVVGNKTTINVVLQPSSESLDEVVVVGYGTTSKKDLTGTVASVKSEDIQEIKAQTIDQALTGRMAGVFVQNRGGQPGAGAFVHIRGLNQIRGDNQPLYVVDGVPIITTPNSDASGTITYTINYGGRENPLLAINPNDIERVDVLKDASAAAIYGSRAANGVVIITTKRGKRNQAPRFSFTATATIQNPVKKYDYLSAPEWIDWVKVKAQETLDNTNVPEAWWPYYYPNELSILNNPNHFGTANTDWQDLITNDNALWQQYSMNVSGGSEKVNYLVSLGYSDQEGVMIENDFKRYNFSTNLDANITDWFKVGTSLNFNYSINKSKGFNTLGNGNFRPDLGAYNEDGSYARYINRYGVETNTLFGDLMGIRKRATSNNLFGSVYAEFKIMEGLKFKSQLNIGLNNDHTENRLTAENNFLYELYFARPGATLVVNRNHYWSTAFENTLSYSKKFDNGHKIDAVAGVSWNRNRYDAESHTYRGFPDDFILIDINSATFVDNAGSESLEQGLNSVFGRINYNFKDKYLATFTARRDGSTKFGPDNQYGFFPSGALAWNMHNESFMEKLDFITSLKLRASMGVTGSDNLPSFTYLAYYKTLDGNASFYDGTNGIVVPGVPNTGIKWEETKQLDLGLDFGLFDNRLTGEIVYFEKNTSGIIIDVPITSQTGAKSWNANVADVSSKGWEFSLGADIVRSTDFSWHSSFNISFIKGKVDNLYNGNVGYQQGIIEGHPIGTTIGYDVIKIAQTQEEIDALNTSAGGLYQSSLTQPGDYIFRDINGDGKISPDDRTPLGDINPDFYGGWNNRIRYKNWDFSMNWGFSKGVQKVYGPLNGLSFIQLDINLPSLVFDTWTPENTNAPYARHGSPTHYGNGDYAYVSRSVVAANYIKLRSLSIGYNLPKSWFGNSGISAVKVILSGNNLFTISSYPGLDPEDVISQSFAGRSSGFNADVGNSYPNVRTFSISLNVTF